ncbi:MAG TPA: amino acid adenylation domain-containing protein, partial [Segetibacter sp.]|nr:amino acid adenylation domain-containing protein [Segetibacter sp.]
IGDLSRHFQTTTFGEGYLTDIVVNYEPLNFESDFGNEVSATVLRLANEHEVTPLQLVWRDYGRNRPLQLHVHYKHEYFNDKEIELLSERLIYVIEQFSDGLNSEVGLIKILPEAERKLVKAFSTSSASSVNNSTIVDLFEEQVAKSPDATAVIFEDEQVTYAELNQKADLLASFLRSKGIKEETCVPLCIERSVGLVVAILGILKAGGAYVPIDPKYPAERINFMLQDVAASLIVTSGESVTKLPGLVGIEIINIDLDWPRIVDGPKEIIKTSLQKSNLAYVIYTSGSTGRPKGVMVEHGNVVSLVKDVDYVSLTNNDILLSTGSPSFDATTFEYWGMLLNGGQLVLSSENTLLDAELLKLEITKRKVTKMWFTSSWFNQLVDTDITVFESLQTIIAGGEKLSETHIEKVRLRYPAIDIINGYGPTENTTFSLTCNITALADVDSIPIGRPLSGRTAFIVNMQHELLPIGESGEILLGGAGLSRGYLNRPELTSEKFIENPFDNEQASRVYRTGDLGRWLPDGNIEYLGRIDEQVKIRGYRIELGEIESVLLQCPMVSQAVVIAKEESNGTKRLIGYVVAKEHFDKQVVTTFLHERLPDYMVPAIWVELDTLPLTSNGKVDKKALPDAENEQLSSNEYVAPQNDVQKTLTAIWENLLGIERVGILDNFFELGGDSILTIQVVSRANHFGFNLQPKDIFVYQTISKLSEKIAEKSDRPIIAEQGQLEGKAGLLPIQQWFLKQENLDISHYNQSVLLSLKKSVTPEILEQAIKHLTAFHDALRFKYYRQNGQWQQEYDSIEGSISVEFVADKSPFDSSINAISKKYQESLDIERGLLFRSVLIKTPENVIDNRFLLVIHHLAIDGVSWRIILEHLELLLTQLSNNETINLGKKSSSYRQWFDTLRQYGKSKHLLAQNEYWQNIVKNHNPLKTDKIFLDNVRVRDCEKVKVQLPADQTQHLLQGLSSVYHTDTNDILLAALTECLCNWNGTEKVVIGLEGHGRENIAEGIDTTKTVGWFTTLYPVLLELGLEQDSDSLIKSTKEQLRRIPDKGLGYGVLKYLNEDEALKNSAGWDVVFNYLGQVDNLNREGLWYRLSDEGAVASRSEQQVLQEKLSIEVIVQSGQLAVTWAYSTKHFKAETIQELATRYIAILSTLISHCLKIKNQLKSVNTPSDYGLGAEINYSELDKFLEELVNGQKRKDLIEGMYRLSGTQQGMLFHSLYNKEAGAYMEQLICDLVAPDITAVQKSWKIVIDQHSILRSAFYYDAFSIAVQCVFKKVELPVAVLDFQDLPGAEQSLAIDNFKAADRSKGFDFKKAPLIRLTLIRLNADSYKMVWTSHHLLFDGWSLPILIEDFLKNYEVVVNGDQPVKKEDNFEDYIRYVEQRDKHEDEEYWSSYLKDLQEATMLPFINATADRNKGVGVFRTEYFTLDSATTLKVQNFAKQHRLTANTIMQGVWSYLLHKYSGNETITYGVTVSGRPDNLPEVEHRVGMFINTVPLKSQLKEDDEIVGWLRALQEDQVASRQHQFISLQQIQNLTAVKGDLFDTTLTFQNYPIKSILTSNDWKLKIENITIDEQNNFPFSLTVSITDEISIRAIYNASLLKEEYLLEIEKHFKNILLQLVSHETVKVNEIKLLTPFEEQTLLKHSS